MCKRRNWTVASIETRLEGIFEFKFFYFWSGTQSRWRRWREWGDEGSDAYIYLDQMIKNTLDLSIFSHESRRCNSPSGLYVHWCRPRSFFHRHILFNVGAGRGDVGPLSFSRYCRSVAAIVRAITSGVEAEKRFPFCLYFSFTCTSLFF